MLLRYLVLVSIAMQNIDLQTSSPTGYIHGRIQISGKGVHMYKGVWGSFC